MTGSVPPASNWDTAVSNADASAALALSTSHRRIRGVLHRLLRPSLDRQSAYNSALLIEFVGVRDDLAAQLATARDAWSEVASQLEPLRRGRDGEDAHFGAIEESLTHHHEVIARMDAVLERHEGLFQALSERLDEAVENIEATRRQAFARLHDEVGAIREELSLVADALADHRNAPHLGVTDVSGGERPRDADLVAERYAAVQAAFRGPREQIIERARPYAERIATVNSGARVLDIGYGRGELLEVLHDAGISAYGIDTQSTSADALRAKGLDVRLADAHTHLRGLRPGSLRAITAIHVVEHLAVGELVAVLKAAFDALEHGGMLLMETPNPDNVLVASSRFHLDPTHRVPVPSALLELLVGEQGFEAVTVDFPARADDAVLVAALASQAESGDLRALVDELNRKLFAPPDYLLTATRP